MAKLKAEVASRRRGNLKSFSVLIVLVLIAALGAAIVPASPVEAIGTNYYVRTDGSDSNDGSANDAAHAWLTIQHAVDTVATGDTINVAAGTYTETGGPFYTDHYGLKFDVTQGGITLRGANAGTPGTGTRGPESIIEGPDVLHGNAIFIFDGADGVVIDGFTLRAGDDIVENRADDVVIKNNIITPSASPVTTNSPGIFACECDNLTVSYNWVYDIGVTGGGCGMFLGLASYSADITNSLVEHNLIENSGGAGILFNYASGTGGNTVQYNEIKNVGHDGIRAGPPAHGTTIQCNEIYGSARDGVRIMGDAASHQINYNSIYNSVAYGVNNLDAATLDAENNWWGANDGPDDDDGVINGSGDKISTNVDADPWIQFTLAANPTQIVADGTSQSDLTAKLKNSDDTIVAPDAQLNQLPDFAKVTFTTDKGTVGSTSITEDLTDGQATAKLTSSTTVETASVTAQAKNASEAAISGATDTATVDFIPGGSSTVAVAADPEEITADGTSTSTITATVNDQYGHPVADGTDVVFETDHGAFASSTVTKQTVGGVATATLTSESSTEVVIATVTATANGASKTTSVFFIPAGGPGVEESKIETVDGSGTVGDTPTGGDVDIDADGDHTITTAKYDSNPGGSPSFEASGNYYDVHLDDDTGVNSLTIEFCPATASTVIYWWNGTSWVAASNQVYASGCVTVTITATTTPCLADLSGAVFGSGTPTPVPTPAPTPAPAPAPPPGPRASPSMATPTQLPPDMALQYLAVNPQQTYAGQPVTITTNVSNTGGATGSYTVVLMINGQQEASRLVSVGAMSAVPVKFTVTKDVPGTYTVTIGGQQSSFTILGTGGGTSGSPVSGGLIAIILIIGVLLIASVVLLVRRLA